MSLLVLIPICCAALALGLLGLVRVASPRGSFLQELWLACSLTGLPLALGAMFAHASPQRFAKAARDLGLGSDPTAAAVLALAICLISVLALRLALSRPSPYPPDQRAGKKLYRCPLGGFQLLYPQAWRVKRTGPLTYTFAGRGAPGVLRLSRIYSDSARTLVRSFEELLHEAGVGFKQLEEDEALHATGQHPVCRASRHPFASAMDTSRWSPPPEHLERRVFTLNRARLMFLLDYVEPAGGEVDLRPLEDLIASLRVVQATPKPG